MLTEDEIEELGAETAHKKALRARRIKFGLEKPDQEMPKWIIGAAWTAVGGACLLIWFHP